MESRDWNDARSDREQLHRGQLSRSRGHAFFCREIRRRQHDRSRKDASICELSGGITHRARQDVDIPAAHEDPSVSGDGLRRGPVGYVHRDAGCRSGFSIRRRSGARAPEFASRHHLSGRAREPDTRIALLARSVSRVEREATETG